MFKSPRRKKRKDDEQTLARRFKFSSLLFTRKCQLVKTSFINEVIFLVFYIININNRASSVCMEKS